MVCLILYYLHGSTKTGFQFSTPAFKNILPLLFFFVVYTSDTAETKISNVLHEQKVTLGEEEGSGETWA